MRFGSPERWVILRFDASGGLAYRDDRGNTVRARRDGSLLPPRIDVKVAESIALASSESRRLPIFLQGSLTGFKSAAQGLRGSPSLVTATGAFQFARLPARRHAWPPFRLPLRVGAVGAASARINGFFLDGFAQEAQNLEGLTRIDVPPHRIGDLADGVDVVFANEVDALTVLYMTIDARVRPRLVVAVAEQETSSLLDALDGAGDDALLRVASVLYLPPSRAVEAENILYNLIHDEPLHEIAGKLNVPGSPEVLLVSDPAGLHSLRISDAFLDAARRELTEEIGAVEEPQPIFERAIPFGPQPSALRPELLDLDVNYLRETGAFVPTARSEARAKASSTRPSMLRPPAAAAEPPAPQRRRVDARIERAENAPLDLQGRSAREIIWLPPDRTLRQGGRYRLRVQIGRDSPGNLIASSVPDLDSLLPPTKFDGWELDVVVFAKDFRLHGPAMQKLWLGITGPTEALYFDIQAPAEGTRAELRFAIYTGNHLLQSFLLTAIVTPQEQPGTPGALNIDLDLATSDAFANLGALGQRTFSAGVNLDADGKHRVLIKFDEIGTEIPLDNALVDQPLADFRKAMTGASVDAEESPVFPAEGPAQTEEQRAKFVETVRELARVGRLLHRTVFDRGGDELRKKFRDLREAGEKTLQFSRYDANFVMPWTIFYDYILPDDAAGPPEVCDGTKNGAPCGHGTKPGLICINGFWGTRHVIEEQLARAGAPPPPKPAQNAVTTIQRPAACSPIAIADGIGDGTATKLLGDLQGKIDPKAAVLVQPPQKVLEDVLWKDAARPAVMMFLGHLDESGPARKIQIPGNLWLTAADISDAALELGDWTQPNSLVLLMACEAMQADSRTLHDHALALRAAGAAAVVGPECPVFSPFACRVARELLLALLTAKPPRHLGEALTELRRTLAAGHNPLGFAFTVFGDTDVAIA